MLEAAPALLVLSGGRPLAVITRTDILSYFEAVAGDDGLWVSEDQESEPAAGVRDPGDPRRAGAGPHHRRRRHADLAGDDVRPGGRRRAPGYEYSRSGNPTRTAARAVHRVAGGGAPTGSPSPAGWPPRTPCCACSGRPPGRRRVLLGNDAYGGTYRLIAKVWGPLRRRVGRRRPHRRRRARRVRGRTTPRWCGWRRRPTRC